MADQLLEQVRDLVEGQIDFEGQKLAELLTTWTLAALGGIVFIIGFFLQDIKLTLQLGLGGAALTALLVVPPWPFYNQHPVRWLPPAGSELKAQLKAQGITVDGQVVG